MSRVVRVGTLPFVQTRRRSDGEALGLIADLSADTGLGRLQVAIEVLAPGHRSSPPHRHSHTEEAIYVLDGTPTLSCGEQTWLLGPGDFAALPAGGPPHVIENHAPQSASLLVLRAPGEADVVDYGASGLDHGPTDVPGPRG